MPCLNDNTPAGTTIKNKDLGATAIVIGPLQNGWINTNVTCIEKVEFGDWEVVEQEKVLPGYPYSRKYSTECYECGNDLCQKGSVIVGFILPISPAGDVYNSQLNKDGWLMEPTDSPLANPIEHGYQSSAACHECGEYIEATETAGE